jgi:hypothetical protein
MKTKIFGGIALVAVAAVMAFNHITFIIYTG